MFADALLLSDMPEVGVKKIALYFTPGGKADARVFVKRGPDGSLTAFSAVCTHLGCVVNYDRLKDQFICPCHGGIYDGKRQEHRRPAADAAHEAPGANRGRVHPGGDREAVLLLKHNEECQVSMSNLFSTINERLSLRRHYRRIFERPLPKGVTYFYCLGGIAFFFLLILTFTGVVLSFYYVPSSQ